MKPLWTALAFLVALPLCFYLLTGVMEDRLDQETLSQAGENVRRAAVQCYALEGAYPRTLSYLKEHYGVTGETDQWRVEYTYVASNLMPDILVIPRKP